MYSIKGFGRITERASNQPGQVAPFGELTSQSLTYGREVNRGYWIDTAKGNVELVTFSAILTSSGENVVPPANLTSVILSVINWLQDRSEAQALAATGSEIAAQITAEFTNLSSATCGIVVTSGIYRMPSSVTFTVAGMYAGNSTTVWFSDSHFQQEYDLREYVIIPPVTQVDQLFETSPVVETALNSRGMDEWFALKEAAIGIDPPTDEVAEVHNRISILSPQTLKTSWVVLQYGIAADDPDARREAIVAYIMANTTRTLAEWRALIPSLFVKTEFVFVPMFNEIAIPNFQTEAGIYSPTTSIAKINSYAALGAVGGLTGYSTFIEVMATTYKSMLVVGYGHQDNVDGIRRISEKWPKYINVHTESADFNRMDVDTRGWVAVMMKLYMAAESMTANSPLPAGVKRVIRAGKIFATASYKQVQYSVYAKANFS